MGQPKQLLHFRGKTLIERAATQAIEAGLSPVIVVLGANASAASRAVAGLPVEIAQNENWQSGMGSSIAAGIHSLLRSQPEAAGVAILLADQPLINAKHLSDMRELLGTGDIDIVAAEYSGTLGVPAFFARELFSLLAAIPADSGARRIIHGQRARVTAYSLPEAAIDIDTPDDYAALH